MSAVIDNFSMQQIAISNRIAAQNPDSEAQEREIAAYTRSALCDMVANIQKDESVAIKVADEMLCKLSPEDMAKIVRAAFANEPLELQTMVLRHAGVAMNTLAELEAYRAFN